MITAADELSETIQRLPVSEGQKLAAEHWQRDEAAAEGRASGRSAYDRQVEDRVDGGRGETAQERSAEAQQRLAEVARCLGGADGATYAMVRGLVIDGLTAGLLAERHAVRVTTVGDVVRMGLTRIGRQVYGVRA